MFGFYSVQAQDDSIPYNFQTSYSSGAIEVAKTVNIIAPNNSSTPIAISGSAAVSLTSSTGIKLTPGFKAGEFSAGASFLTQILPVYPNGCYFNIKPVNDQLYPRDANNHAVVKLQGKIIAENVSNASIEVYLKKKNESGYTSIAQYSITATFDINVTIDAALQEYKFMVHYNYGYGTSSSHITVAESVVCGDAYIITGQSNALANTIINGSEFDLSNMDSRYQKSFGDPTSPTFGSNYKWGASSSVNGSVAAHNIIPVGVWGLKLQNILANTYNMPTCIINGADGGTKIIEHLKGTKLYNNILARASASGLSSKIKAIFWYQGESDAAVDPESACDLYAEKFTALHNDWKKDYTGVSKIYVVQLFSGWPQVAEIQRKFASMFSDVKLMSTNGIGSKDGLNGNGCCHFLSASYANLGIRLSSLVGYDFYNSSTQNTAPNILKAYYSGSNLVLQYDQNLSSTDLSNVIDDFYFDISNVVSNGGSINGDKLTLTFPAGTPVLNSVSYLNVYPSDYSKVLLGQNGIGAFSFYNIKIGAEPTKGSVNYNAVNHWTYQMPCPTMLGNVAGDLVVSADGNYVFYKTFDGDINALHLVNGTWVHTDLDNCIQNGEVAGSLAVMASNKVFYVTKNKALHCIYITSNGTWGASDLNNCAPNGTVGGNIAIDINEHVFYRTYNNDINMIYWVNNQWCRTDLNDCVQNNKVGSSLVCNDYNQCFYRTTDNDINAVYLTSNGTWGWSDLNNCVSNNKVAGELRVNPWGQVFYRTTNGLINCVYFSANQWNWSGLNDQTCGNVQAMNVDHTGEVFYINNSNNTINSIYWDSNTGNWKKTFLENIVPKNARTSLVTNSSKIVFYIGLDNKIHSLSPMNSNSFKKDSEENSIAEVPLSESAKFNLYPNPVDGNLNIKINGMPLNSVFQVEFIDLSGKIVLKNTVNDSGTLSTSALENGFYVVLIKEGNTAIHREKILVMH